MGVVEGSRRRCGREVVGELKAGVGREAWAGGEQGYEEGCRGPRTCDGNRGGRAEG